MNSTAHFWVVDGINICCSAASNSTIANDQAFCFNECFTADEYTAANVFWVPEEARWSFLQAKAKTPEIGKLVDGAMDAIERENRSLKGVLPKVYALPGLNQDNLGQGAWYLSFYNEIFINGETDIGDGREVEVFDRNRLYGAVGYSLSDSLKIQGGYMHQSTNSVEKGQIQLSLHHRF